MTRQFVIITDHVHEIFFPEQHKKHFVHLFLDFWDYLMWNELNCIAASPIWWFCGKRSCSKNSIHFCCQRNSIKREVFYSHFNFKSWKLSFFSEQRLFWFLFCLAKYLNITISLMLMILEEAAIWTWWITLSQDPANFFAWMKST